MQRLTLDRIKTKLRELMPVLRQKYHVRTLEVFDSYVRGEAREVSDLDLLVTFEKTTLFQFIELKNFLTDVIHVKVDLVMKSALKPRIGKFVLREAQPI